MFASKDVFLTPPATGGYTIARSVRLRSSASAYLNRTPASATNRKTWTWSGWVKRGLSVQYGGLFTAWSSNNASGYAVIRFDDDQLVYKDWVTVYRQTSQVFRDFSAWYHIVVAIDTTQATAANRVKMYVNGVQVTAFATSNDITQNSDTNVNNNVLHTLGVNYFTSAPQYFTDGYLTEINFIDGQQLTPSSFGSTNALTGVWQPAKYTGTYGTNGFYLNFSSNGTSAALGTDFSGNSNTWTVNNISVTSGVTYDSMTDVPTLTSATAANYAVMNPLNLAGSLANGNLQHTGASSQWSPSSSTIAFDASQNFYAEVYINSTNPSINGIQLGIVGSTQILTGSTSTLGNFATGYSLQTYLSGGTQNLFHNGTGSNYASGVTLSSGDYLGIQLNSGTLTFYKNGTSLGSAFTGITGSYCFASSPYGTDYLSWNFGQQGFKYTPPTGALALNTYNLPTSTITNGAAYMAATLYTGNGTTTGNTQAISNAVNGVSFQPDFVWLKSRSNGTYFHLLNDSVRGVNKTIYSNTATSEDSVTNVFNSFDSGGFTAAYNSSYGQVVSNANTVTYVGWQWKGGGTAVSNTAGNITSSVSANTTTGFSVVTYTGIGGNVAKTFGHGCQVGGLATAPSMVIVKDRDNGSTGVNDWVVWHSTFTGSEYIYLDLVNGKATSANYWGGTVPSTTLVTVGGNSSNVSNESGIRYVAYCFAAVKGYSAFGSYDGNSDPNGPFVYLGFRPRWLMIKRSSTASVTYGWQMYDTARQPYNTASSDPNLWADTAAAEGTGNYTFDLLSNGFKLRSSGANENASGSTYIYAAFAENPFKNALAR
jgi:hypothetical protein